MVKIFYVKFSASAKLVLKAKIDANNFKTNYRFIFNLYVDQNP